MRKERGEERKERKRIKEGEMRGKEKKEEEERRGGKEQENIRKRHLKKVRFIKMNGQDSLCL